MARDDEQPDDWALRGSRFVLRPRDARTLRGATTALGAQLFGLPMLLQSMLSLLMPLHLLPITVAVLGLSAATVAVAFEVGSLANAAQFALPIVALTMTMVASNGSDLITAAEATNAAIVSSWRSLLSTVEQLADEHVDQRGGATTTTGFVTALRDLLFVARLTAYDGRTTLKYNTHAAARPSVGARDASPEHTRSFNAQLLVLRREAKAAGLEADVVSPLETKLRDAMDALLSARETFLPPELYHVRIMFLVVVFGLLFGLTVYEAFAWFYLILTAVLFILNAVVYDAATEHGDFLTRGDPRRPGGMYGAVTPAPDKALVYSSSTYRFERLYDETQRYLTEVVL
jgi:hypothetical protein